jgi:DNA-binding IscR family transcriptional regulator
VEISLHEVITALGGPLVDPAHCRRFGGNRDSCIHVGDCTLHDVLGGLSGVISEFLLSTTLNDMISKRERSETGAGRRVGRDLDDGAAGLPDAKTH